MLMENGPAYTQKNSFQWNGVIPITKKMDLLSNLFIAMRNELSRAIVKIAPPHTVEDIVQETYVRLCHVDDQGKIRHPRAFLHQTVKNLALDYVKRADVRLNTSMETDELFHPLEDSTFREASSQQEFGLFCDAVRHLPVQCRKVFVLKKVYNYSQQEIANELGISQSTVEKHIALGIRRCRNYLEVQPSTVASNKRGLPSESQGGAH